jgi:hypothetical protein
MMNNSPTNLEEMRPKLIPSLLSGLDTVANHIWLIILPVMVDLSLWIAPHLGVKTVLQPFVNSLKEYIQMNPQKIANFSAVQEIWQTLIDRLNLVMAVHTIPVGIPSLMANWLPVTTPFGQPVQIDLKSASEIGMWWLVLALLGLILSGIYFAEISRYTSKKQDTPLTPGVLGWITLQLLVITGLTIMIGLLFGVPVLLVISGLAAININLGFFVLFLGSLVFIWMVVPLIFSAHGIFTNHLPVIRSIATSIQVVRLNFPSTGMFLLASVVISQGLNMLWQVPQENSWLLLVGIVGHAFITTSLFAASFHFYRDGLHFLQAIITKNQMAQSSTPATIK